MVPLDSEVVRVNPARMERKGSLERAANVVKLAPQVFQELRVKMAKTDPLENPEQTDCRALQEKGVLRDSEDLPDPPVLQEKRVPVGSVVAQALQDLEEGLENLAEMVPLELQE